ncbi:MAG: zinc dependent phospholipase C family protein [Deltaproteobacteria bacterium]|nr:zinc dependent phospholipase C family protein [Deltaproteobacteria bacterium]
MPASIVHMLISRKVREQLSLVQGYKKFGKILSDHQVYMELGSLGPDLPYYESTVKAGFNLLLDRSDKPMGVDQWSYQLHSKSPNIFPLKMIEIAWREADPELDNWEEDDQQKFAFICGFLTHMAADQIIHPLVNKVAGPYYKSGDHREVHRECEVYQDVVVYQELHPGQGLLDEKPNLWCDLNPGWGDNTPVWFRYFLQKAFVEAHSITPSDNNIEDWVDGILFTLRGLNNFGPYVKAARDFSTNGKESVSYKRFYAETNYDGFFQQAIDLGLIYVKTVFALFDIDHLSDDERHFFKAVVQNADLSAPLQKDIYASAKKRFAGGITPKAAPQT